MIEMYFQSGDKINSFRNTIITSFIILFLLMSSATHGSEKHQVDSMRVVSPRSALIRSAIIPGWGQLYVKKPLKAVMYISLEAYHIYRVVEYNSIYQYVKDTKESVGVVVWNSLSEAEKKEQVKAVTGYDLSLNTWRPREKRNKYAWWCFGIYIIGMLDAYVDAHLYNFPSNNIELAMDSQAKSVGINISFNFRDLNGN